MSEMGKVALLCGGFSRDNIFSKDVDMILDSLLKQSVDVTKFDTTDRTITDLASEGYDRAYLGLCSLGGEDGSIQGTLEYMKIPYTGSGVMASALAFDKRLTKQVWGSLGLATAEFKSVTRGNVVETDLNQVLQDLGGTVVVKPAREGSSLETSVARSSAELVAALDSGLAIHDLMLVEEFLPGREFTVTYLRDKLLPAVELLLEEGGIYAAEQKVPLGPVRYRCPCSVSAEEEKRMSDLAGEAVRVLGVEGVARVDMRQNKQGQLVLLEINTCPYLGENSPLYLSLQAANISVDEYTLTMLASASLNKQLAKVVY